MRLPSCLLFVLLSAASLAQGWQRRYDMTGLGRYQTAWGVERKAQSFVIFTASAELDEITPDSAISYSAIFLTGLNDQGDTLWQKRHALPEHGLFPGWANCCDTVADQGYIVGGGSQSFANVIAVHLMRFTPEGDTLWTRRFGSPGHYWIGRQVKHTQDGGFLIVGDTDATGGDDGFAIKTDSNGNELWRRTYGGSGDQVFAAADQLGSGWICGGRMRNSSESKNFWLVRLDAEGELVWQHNWGGIYDEPNAHLSTLRDGHIIVASAWGYDVDFESTKPYLAKLDSSNGSIIWDREYGPATYSTSFFAVKENPDNDLIACGVSYYTGQQGLLLRTTAQGDSLWMRSYFYQDAVIQEGQGRFYDVLPTSDGGFIATGAAYNPRNMGYPAGYSQDTWVVKVDGDGCLLPGCGSVGITEQATNLLDAIRIWPNPAPVGSTVNVELDLPPALQGKPMQLSLTDATGKLVYTTNLPNHQPNTTNHPLPTHQFTPGLHYLHVQSGSTWYTGGKLVVE